MTNNPSDPPPEDSALQPETFDPYRHASPGNPLLGGLCIFVGGVLLIAGGLCSFVFPQGILINGPIMVVGGLLCLGGPKLWRGEGGGWAAILLVLVGLGLLFIIGLCASGPGYM